MRPLAALLIALLTACLLPTQAPAKGPCTFVYVHGTFLPEEQADIQAAEDAWSKAVGVCFRPAWDPVDADLIFVRAATVADITDSRPDTAVGLWVPASHRIWIVPLDSRTPVIAAHEIGHFLGLEHTLERPTVMAQWIEQSVPNLSGGIPLADTEQYARAKKN